MATTSTAAVQLILKARNEAKGTLSEAEGQLKGLRGAFAGVAKGAAVLGGVAAAGVAALAGVVGKLALDAAKIEPVRITFENLTADIGTTADAMLERLRPATMGTLRDFELMNAANKLMAMGLADSVESAASMAEMAVTLGAAMGVEAGPAIENFTLMLANQSIPRLDTYGISSGKVRERILELMDATEGMTREQAFMIATMEEGEKAMGRVGDISGTTVVTMAQLKTTVGNLKDSIGTALLPVLAAVLKPLAAWATEHGPAIQAWGEEFAAWLIDEAVPAVTAFIVTVSGLVDTVLGWFQDDGPAALSTFQETWAQVWASVEAIAETVWGAIGPFITEQAQYIVGWFQENWPLIQETVRTVREFVEGIIRLVLERVRMFWEDHGATILRVVGNTWDSIKTAIDAAIKVVLGIIKTVMLLITGDWEGAWNEIKAIGETIWVALQTIVENGVDSVVAVVEAMGETLSGIWNTMVEKAIEIGGAIVGGLIDGIKSMAGSLVSAATGVINDAIGAAKRLLGIGSPSKLFMGFGADMMTGMGQGIQLFQGLPLDALEDVLRKVAEIFEAAQEYWDQFLSKDQIGEIGEFGTALLGLADALRVLVDVDMADLPTSFAPLAEFLKGIAYALGEAQEFWDEFLSKDNITEIAEAADMMAAMGRGLTAMIEGLEGLAIYEGAEDLADRALRFRLDMQTLIEQFRLAAEEMQLEAGDATTAFAEAVEIIFSGVYAAVAGLQGIMDFAEGPESFAFALQSFNLAIDQALQSWDDWLVHKYTPEALEATSLFWETTEGIWTSLGAAVVGLARISEFEAIPWEVINSFADMVSLALTELVMLADDFDMRALDASESFLKAVTQMMLDFRAALETMRMLVADATEWRRLYDEMERLLDVPDIEWDEKLYPIGTPDVPIELPPPWGPPPGGIVPGPVPPGALMAGGGLFGSGNTSTLIVDVRASGFNNIDRGQANEISRALMREMRLQGIRVR